MSGEPNSPGDIDGFVVVNPGSVGNPDETPDVFVGDSLRALLNPCDGAVFYDEGNGGYCGGVNGWHANGCPNGRG